MNNGTAVKQQTWNTALGVYQLMVAPTEAGTQRRIGEVLSLLAALDGMASRDTLEAKLSRNSDETSDHEFHANVHAAITQLAEWGLVDITKTSVTCPAMQKALSASSS